jgi:Flp pilus assembly protein protease CpaA
MIDMFLIFFALIVLCIAAFCDIKKHEVPDWISYGFLITAAAVRILFSIFNHDFSYFLSGFLGLIVFFAVSFFLYASGQWGGGDVKIAMGLGVVIGFSVDALLFLFLLIFIGAFYGILWSIVLAIKNRARFVKSFSISFIRHRFLFLCSITFLFLSLLLSFTNVRPVLFVLFVGLGVILSTGVLLFVFVKSVENVCFFKRIPVSKLTEGDWVAETIRMNGKVIINKKNQGITSDQIKLLKNYKKYVLIKEGIPFIPVFFLAFIVLLFSQQLLPLLI